MLPQRSLLVTTIDPWPTLPRVHRLAMAEARGAAYRFDPRDRPAAFAVLQLGLAGQGRVWLGDGRMLSVQPGELLCLRTRHDDLRYGLQAGDPAWRIAYAELAGPAALATMAELTTRHGHVLRPADPDGLQRMIASFADRAGEHRACWDAAASARAAMGLFAAAMPRPEAEASALVERAVAYFDTHLAGPAGVAEAAAALGVGREHLTRRMRLLLGEPPAAWLRRRRLERARELLASPDARVAQVAAAVGYASPARFGAAYRRRFGRSPGLDARL